MDETCQTALKHIQATKLDSLSIQGAYEQLKTRSESCIFSLVHFQALQGLIAEITLPEAVRLMETTIREKLLSQADKTDKKVKKPNIDFEENKSAYICIWSRR